MSDRFGGQMNGEVEPYQAPTFMTQDHQTVEQLKKRGRYHEEVDRSSASCMVAHEGLQFCRRVLETSAP